MSKLKKKIEEDEKLAFVSEAREYGFTKKQAEFLYKLK